MIEFMGNGRIVSICNVCRDDRQILVFVQYIPQGSRIDHAIQYLECIFSERQIRDEHLMLNIAGYLFVRQSPLIKI